ncbi:protein deadlock [Drosophila busckii]|uniref:protein deadlock n=1 Tax=Drosophila busckii TaxID=30019 RepID=UPI00083EB184|nr:protein deadlock [Drosophila busckii]
MRRREIQQLFAQIVQSEGEDKYTSEEWQEIFDDFWKCMLDITVPCVRLDTPESLDELLRKSKEPVPLSRPPSPDDLEPLSVWRARMRANFKPPQPEKIEKVETQLEEIKKVIKSAPLRKQSPTTVPEFPKRKRGRPRILKKKNETQAAQGKEKQNNKDQVPIKKCSDEVKVKDNKIKDEPLKVEIKSKPFKEIKIIGTEKAPAINIKPKKITQTKRKPMQMQLIKEAHVHPITPINLKITENILIKEKPIQLPLSADDLSLPKNATPSLEADNKINNMPLENITHENHLPKNTSHVLDADNQINNMQFENMTLESHLQLDNEMTELFADNIVDQFMDVEQTVGVEEIDRFIESFSNKTPSEIDDALADTTHFFEKLSKTPIDLDRLDYEYDENLDGDILSMDTSWEGDSDDDNAAKQTKKKYNLKTASNKEQQQPQEIVPSTAKAAAVNKAMARKQAEPQSKGQIIAIIPADDNLSRQMKIKENLQPAQTEALQQSARKTPTAPTTMPKFRIQKISKTQPTQQNYLPLDNIIKSMDTNGPTSQIKKGNGHQTQQQACIERRVTATPAAPAPIFAPPYRRPAPAAAALPVAPPPPAATLPVAPPLAEPLPVAPPAAAVEADLPIKPCKGIYAALFGINCWKYLSKTCEQSNCNHTFNDAIYVQRCLSELHTRELLNSYSFVLRHGMLFKYFFMLYANVFSAKQFLWGLQQMVEDCALYMDLSAPFLMDLYQCLLRHGMPTQAAAGHFMQHLWQPKQACKYIKSTNQLLLILAHADWYSYIPQLDQLLHNEPFPLPLQFLSIIAHNAMTTNQPELVKKASDYLLFYPINKSTENLSSALQLLQSILSYTGGQRS